MITKRIIPCLDVKDGVIKGEVLRGGCVASPMELAKFYSDGGADELLFCDIMASEEERGLFVDLLREVARQVFIPLTVGGGIRSLADFERVLSCGADKVSVNTVALLNPAIVGEAARKYGNQCVVLSTDVRRVNGAFHVFAGFGKKDTGLDALEWIKRCVGEGAGEVVVNSLDADNDKNGFDIELLRKVCEVVDVPVIASGGASCQRDFVELFKKIPEIDAGLAGTAFHLGEIEMQSLKETLSANGVIVRR
ncbi:MAG: imidazole glycerol phosphate synthase subunit HisF [Clostridia bacterium]|nr:imidazole glycerol phosphate synthase subunit HisF [Clostridia bacterium]